MCVTVNGAIGDDGLTALAEGLKSTSNLTNADIYGACVAVPGCQRGPQGRPLTVKGSRACACVLPCVRQDVA